MMILKFIFGLCFCGVLCMAHGQDRRTGTIEYQKEGQGYRIRVEIPPPRTIPGARKAFDEHLIEFGDGTHSFEAAPLHNFPPGSHTIRTSIINNYDDGKPPKIPPRIIEADPAQTDAGSHLQTMIQHDESLEFLVFQDPMPMEEVVCIITYRNTTSSTVSGTIDLYFNEQLYGNSHFEFIEARLHHGEMEVPEDLLTGYSEGPQDQTLADVHEMNFVLFDKPVLDRHKLQSEFEERRQWEFTNMKPGEERNIYVSLMATSAMLKDTNATVRLAATVESDDRRIQSVKVSHKQIVTSHDPNRMTVRPRKMHFARRLTSPIEYYVRFQNYGEGPARQISVHCSLSENIDLQSLRIMELYPPCPWCPQYDVTYGCIDTIWREEEIIFNFRNIYLPGREQNITGKDSTKGFIRFEVTPGKKQRKVPFDARAEIIFDQNEPIRTNSPQMGFKADYKTGLIGGIHDNRPEDADPSTVGYFGGIVLAPYKPYRFYYQAEIMPVYSNYFVRNLSTGMKIFDLRQVRVDIVPLQLRKNLASFAGVGAGIHLSTLVYSQRIENGVKSDPQWFEDMTPSVFADINLGAVRQGISGGARYSQTLGDPGYGYWSIYLVLRR